MRQLCSESSCSYLGRSALQAARFLTGSADVRNGIGDEAEVSRRHSSWRS